LVPRLRVLPHPVHAPSDPASGPGSFDLAPGVTHALIMFDGRSAFDRKNPWAAIEAWVRAFPTARADAGLIIKGANLRTDPTSHRRLMALAAGRPDVRLIEADLAEDELWRLLAGIDLFISLHRGEGFGLVAAEAMTLGKPVIMTGWSGVMDFADETSAALIPYSLIPARDPTGAYRQGLWADPDIDTAAQVIRELIDHPEKARALGARAPARIAALNDNWSTDRLTALPFASLIDNSDRRPAP